MYVAKIAVFFFCSGYTHVKLSYLYTTQVNTFWKENVISATCSSGKCYCSLFSCRFGVRPVFVVVSSASCFTLKDLSSLYVPVCFTFSVFITCPNLIVFTCVSLSLSGRFVCTLVIFAFFFIPWTELKNFFFYLKLPPAPEFTFHTTNHDIIRSA